MTDKRVAPTSKCIVEDLDDRGNPLFGDWSGIPRGEGSRFVPAPVGVPCLVCAEPIAEGDAGEIMPSASAINRGVIAWAAFPVHRECTMLGISGHAFGVCSCTNFGGQPSKRAAALELDRRITADNGCANKITLDEAVAILKAHPASGSVIPDPSERIALRVLAHAHARGELSHAQVEAIFKEVAEAVFGKVS